MAAGYRGKLSLLEKVVGLQLSSHSISCLRKLSLLEKVVGLQLDEADG